MLKNLIAIFNYLRKKQLLTLNNTFDGKSCADEKKAGVFKCK